MSCPASTSSSPTHRWWRPRGLPLLELLVVCVLLVLFVPWGSLTARWRTDDTHVPVPPAFAVLTADMGNGPTEIVAFDELTGEVVQRLPGQSAQTRHLVVDAAARRVYVATSIWHDATSATHTLAAYALDDWSVQAEVLLEEGVTELTLAPGGDGVVLRFNIYTDTSHLWLEHRSGKTLDLLARSSATSPLSSCAASRLVAAAHTVLLLCAGVGTSSSQPIGVPLTLHAVDIGRMKIIASLPLDQSVVRNNGSVGGVVVGADGTEAVLVFSDLQLVVVDSTTLAMRHDERRHVDRMYEVRGVQTRAERLIVTLTEYQSVNSATQVRWIDMASLAEVRRLDVAPQTAIFPGPADSLYRRTFGSATLVHEQPDTGKRRFITIGTDAQTIGTLVVAQ